MAENMKHMNAKEARELAMSITEGKASIQYAEIMNYIESAVRDGKFKIKYQHTVFPAVISHLKQNGFGINITSHYREGTMTIISW